ncbi:MAG: hypothetical protein ACRDS1_07210 [Pseudonocardiaceae bacterium]
MRVDIMYIIGSIRASERVPGEGQGAPFAGGAEDRWPPVAHGVLDLGRRRCAEFDAKAVQRDSSSLGVELGGPRAVSAASLTKMGHEPVAEGLLELSSCGID